jgi:hypothetical protein
MPLSGSLPRPSEPKVPLPVQSRGHPRAASSLSESDLPAMNDSEPALGVLEEIPQDVLAHILISAESLDPPVAGAKLSICGVSTTSPKSRTSIAPTLSSRPRTSTSSAMRRSHPDSRAYTPGGPARIVMRMAAPGMEKQRWEEDSETTGVTVPAYGTRPSIRRGSMSKPGRSGVVRGAGGG